MFKKILVAIDGSPTSNHGFAVALGLAEDQHAELCALHVVDEMSVVRGFAGAEYGAPQYYENMIDDLRKAGRKTLSKADALAAKRNQSIKTVLVETHGRTVAQAIVAQARELRCDLIVMGTHGRRGLSRLVMGSDAEGVLREARVPVLLVRSPASVRAGRRAKPAVHARHLQQEPVAGARAVDG